MFYRLKLRVSPEAIWNYRGPTHLLDSNLFIRLTNSGELLLILTTNALVVPRSVRLQSQRTIFAASNNGRDRCGAFSQREISDPCGGMNFEQRDTLVREISRIRALYVVPLKANLQSKRVFTRPADLRSCTICLCVAISMSDPYSFYANSCLGLPSLSYIGNS